MFLTQPYSTIRFASRMDEGVTGPASFPAGEGVENSEDEAQIVADQDQTGVAKAGTQDEVMGGMGTSDFGLDSGEFARGEIDVREQMDRATSQMDASTGRTEELARPGSGQGEVDVEAAAADSLRHDDEEEAKYRKPLKHGHETGGFTDIGAGRSGVTRTRAEDTRH